MSQSHHKKVWCRVSGELATVRGGRVNRLARQAAKSGAMALVLAVMTVGAADHFDLPQQLQHVVSHFDIASYFRMPAMFSGSQSGFMFWVLPINAIFYGLLVFAYYSWRAHQAQPNLLTASPSGNSTAHISRAVVDPAIPTLATVLDGQELARHLGSPSSPKLWGTLRGADVNVLTWRSATRCVFEVVFRTDMVGKVYAIDRRDVYEMMTKISCAGFGQEDEYSIPQPIAYLPSLRLLLQERVEGTKASKIFLHGNERERSDAAERCAHWLARFHTLAPRCAGRVIEVDDELSRIRGWVDCLARLMKSDANKLELLYQELEAAAARLGPMEYSSRHGSYSPDHVLLMGRRTVTIDWDGVDVGDPTRDVARFIVAVQRLALGRRRSIHALDAVAECFRDAYLKLGPAGVEGRLQFFRAATFLQLAMYCAFHHPDRHGERKVMAMLEEARGILAGQKGEALRGDMAC